MQNKKKPVLTPSMVLAYGVIIKNPVLVQVIGLCPAVAASADLYVSILLSFLVTVLLVVCECFASLFLKRIPRTIRVGIYFLIGLVLCTGVTYFLEQEMPELLNRAGVYLPLMAASSAVALRSETFAVKKKLRYSFLDAVANGVGTSLVLLFSGLVRGLLGTGKIGDWVVFSKAPLQGLAMPFGGFLVLGFSAAFLKWFMTTFLRQYDANMAFGIEKKKKKKAPATKRPAPAPAVQAPKPETPVEPAANVPDEKPVESPAPVKKPSVPKKAEPKPKPEGNAESHAVDFYEQAALDELPDMDDALFSVDDIFVQAELDAILENIASFDSILTDSGKGEDNA